MTIIELMAKDQKLDIMVEPVVAAGDVKSTKIHVEFSPEWSGYAKTAVFFTSKDVENVIEQVMTDNTCKVPAEVIEKATNLFIGVRGVISSTGAVKTSTLVKYKIEEGAPCGTGTTVPPTADVYQQLLSKTNDLDKRLSNLIAAETKDGEVIDMRVGADGVKYGTAGEAVRAQLKAITDKFAMNEQTVTLEESQIDKTLNTFIVTSYGEDVSRLIAEDAKGYFLIVKEVQQNDIVKLSENVVLDFQNPHSDRIVFTDNNHAMTNLLFFSEVENNDYEFRVQNDGYMYLSAEYTSDTTDLFTIKRMVNFIQSPKTAKVGQMLVVEAVDENGFPISWKTVTPSSGGGNSGAGNDGVGILSVVQTTTSTEDGGVNVITVTKTDGTKSTFQVRNGSKGAVGIVWKGEWVENGYDGKGYKENDVVSCNGNLYIAQTDLTFEDPIKYGADWGLLLPKGYTPQKGVDYFTEADKAELVTNVLNALPTWTGGAY